MVDTVIGLAMLGTAAAIHFRPRRHRQRVRRQRVRARPRRLHFRLRWLPLPLALAGVAMIVAGWLRPDPVDESTVAPDLAALVAVAEGSLPALGEGGGMILVRGTPADDDSATESEIRDYSTRLGTLLAGVFSRPPLALDIEAEAIDAEQWAGIRDDHSAARNWCKQDGSPAFVAVIGMSALRLENGAGFAPWREPEFLVLSCADDREVALRGRANERLGDRVPYEQSIAEDLRAAIGRLAAASN